jgi:hypothetical protein
VLKFLPRNKFAWLLQKRQQNFTGLLREPQLHAEFSQLTGLRVQLERTEPEVPDSRL